MTNEPEYPGTPAHRALLRGIVAHYANDPRIRAVSLFGSLGRGNWDAYSDLDLDIVVTDGALLDVPHELQRLSAALTPPGQPAALVVADGPEAGDVVLADLMQFSIRYHPLATTKAAIVDSLRVLSASLDPAAITAAGLANAGPPPEQAAHLLSQCVRAVAGVEVAIQRGQLWAAVEQLHRVRSLLMALYAQSHGGGRALPVFQAHAPADLQARLGGTLPPYHLGGLRGALAQCVALLERDLDQLTNGQAQLTDAQRHVLAQVRAARAILNGEPGTEAGR